MLRTVSTEKERRGERRVWEEREESRGERRERGEERRGEGEQ